MTGIIYRTFFLFGVLFLWLTFASGAPVVFSDELDTGMYNCSFTAKSAANIPADAAMLFWLESEKQQDAILVNISTKKITVFNISQGIKSLRGQVDIKIQANSTKEFFIQRREDNLKIFINDKTAYNIELPHSPGAEGVWEADAGWTIDNVAASRIEPVVLTDDFMRTKDDNGQWNITSGQWKLQSAWEADPHGVGNVFNRALTAQNPFAWMGKATDKPAICIAGKPDWEDYTFSTAVCPVSDAAGIIVNDNLLVRWSAANDRSKRGDRLTIEKLDDGKTVLAECRGGYIPGQWYKLSAIASNDGVVVQIDGQERLRFDEKSRWHGWVGLYSESKDGTTFDDVTVYGRLVKTSLIAESGQRRIQERFLRDYQGMRNWAAPDEWSQMPDNTFVNKNNYYGDQWLTAEIMPYNANGSFELSLNGDGKGLTSGYRAVIKSDIAQKKMTYQILHDMDELANGTGNLLTPNENTNIRLDHRGDLITLEVDDEKVLSVKDTRPVTGMRPAYRITGGLGRLKSIIMMGSQYRDYTFTSAPTDWYTQGTWMPTVRWACQPQWSFYSGWSRGDAVVWHKQRFTGDQSMQAFIGYKMESPRERIFFENKFSTHDANIAICTDGHNPRSGYSVMSGQLNEFGRPSSETVLLRNGVPVQRVNVSVLGWGWEHRTWFNMMLRKRGDTVELYMENALTLSYKDPQPIEGGVPAIWTKDNGISIARVRMHFANPPLPRTDQHVIVGESLNPEWLNVNEPLKLNFPDAWSTADKPVKLNVASRLVPVGSTTPVVEDKKVTITPTKTGEYWYQVTATDGKNISPAFNVFGWTFDPKVGRDDSHALVLYRFNEGDGSVVKDLSKIGTPANLKVPAYPATRWFSGQGLSFSGPEPIKSEAGVEKLMAIARNKACTIEMWVSNDSAYFPIHWLGCLMSWEKEAGKQNFLIGGHKASFIATPNGALFDFSPRNDDNVPTITGSYSAYMAFGTSLHHMVMTWDGTNTQAFTDGVAFDKQQVNWNVDKWVADAPLLLGNRTDSQRQYLGTYYLAAIHDRCMTGDEIKRHYMAGPSAIENK
jgi:hypothetical protein